VSDQGCAVVVTRWQGGPVLVRKEDCGGLAG
jgi:hypothetical protein